MQLAQVIGRVTLNRAELSLKGGRWLVVSPLDAAQFRAGVAGGAGGRLSAAATPVVYDNLGAREGDVIGYVEGAEATAPFDHPIPIDAINVAILEQLDYRPPGAAEEGAKKPRGDAG